MLELKSPTENIEHAMLSTNELHSLAINQDCDRDLSGEEPKSWSTIIYWYVLSTTYVLHNTFDLIVQI